MTSQALAAASITIEEDSRSLRKASDSRRAATTPRSGIIASRSAALVAEIKALQEELGTLAGEQADWGGSDSDSKEGKGSTALPEVEIAIDMRRALKQQGEEMCEKQLPHFATISGANAVDTLEKQDDRQEVNQREDQHILKVQLDSKEEYEGHLEAIAQAIA